MLEDFKAILIYKAIYWVEKLNKINKQIKVKAITKGFDFTSQVPQCPELLLIPGAYIPLSLLADSIVMVV